MVLESKKCTKMLTNLMDIDVSAHCIGRIEKMVREKLKDQYMP